MGKSSQLDAAIELQHYKRPGSSERLREIGKGRDILEAAAKVDMVKRAIAELSKNRVVYCHVIDLLAALPDEEAK